MSLNMNDVINIAIGTDEVIKILDSSNREIWHIQYPYEKRINENTYETVYSPYKLNESNQSVLNLSSSDAPFGYPSVWVDESGTIHGNGTAYTNIWKSYFRIYKSDDPYIYYKTKWYRIVSASRYTAAVVKLSTLIE